MSTLIDRTAVVCGSTQGIGRAVAERFARDGATVILVARHAEGLESVRAGLATDHGQTHRVVQADFDDPAAVQARVEACVAEHGPAHILLNNSGGPAAGLAIAADAGEFEAGFRRHLVCNQVLAQLVAPGMRAEGYGRIINIISTSVVTPIRGLGVSNTIRGAVANWGRTLAVELGQYGITVNNLLPGFTATARLSSLIEGKARRGGISTQEVEQQMKATIPAGRFASADEIAAVCAFLASPDAAYINGVNLPVDGGRLAG